MRRAIGVRISEERKVYEGEVKSIEVRKTRHPSTRTSRFRRASS